MKAIIRLIFLVVVLNCAEAQEASQQCPNSSTLIIDGHAEEWPMTWIVDEEKIFSYNVCADDHYLYVRVRTSDYYAKRKIAAFGFTLWIDPNGKKRKKLGLRFPMGGSEAEERAAAIRSEGAPGISAMEKADFQMEIDRKLIADLEILELLGLADEAITSTRSGITNGIKVAIAMDAEGAYIYEALVPFKSYRLSKASLSELDIGFESGRYIVPKVKSNTKGGAMIDYTNAMQMSRMQGYEGLMGNPKLTYSTYAWTTLKLK